MAVGGRNRKIAEAYTRSNGTRSYILHFHTFIF